MDAPLRIAVVSTPRAGNTWIRHLLGTAYQIPHLARHSMSDSDWSDFPRSVVLQLHWRRTPDFVAKLNEHGFRVVTVARHPLDVLVSILHFCIYDSESEQWLLGAGGSEADIYAAMPRSRAFIEYAKGPRAAELLAATLDWWGQPGVVNIRYEDCVLDADKELQRLEGEFGPVLCGSRTAAIEECSIDRLRPIATNNHFWKGSPGLWRSLLPAVEAQEIAESIRGVVDHLGYSCEPDLALTGLAADQNWIRLIADDLKKALGRSTQGHLAALRAKDDRIAELDRHCEELTRRLNESVTLSGPVPRAFKRVWKRVRGQ